jgi:hypothetical protein
VPHRNDAAPTQPGFYQFAEPRTRICTQNRRRNDAAPTTLVYINLRNRGAAHKNLYAVPHKNDAAPTTLVSISVVAEPEPRTRIFNQEPHRNDVAPTTLVSISVVAEPEPRTRICMRCRI